MLLRSVIGIVGLLALWILAYSIKMKQSTYEPCHSYFHMWSSSLRPESSALLTLPGVCVLCVCVCPLSFVLMYLVIVVVNLAKNIMVLYWFMRRGTRDRKELEDFDIFLVVLLWGDVCLLTPLSFYSCFWLYRSVALTHLTF